MAESLGWGILAPGGIAHAMVKDLQLAGRRVAAVGSRDLERAQAFADSYGIAAAHGSYEQLVHDTSVDIVYVASPQNLHEEHALLAIAAGKHVLVEKPFTLSAPQAQRVVDAAAEAGVVVLEAMWTRWLPHMVRIREILDAGTIGEVRAVLADHGQKLPDDPDFRLQKPEVGGGALLDLGIYPVAFAWDVLGAPATVSAIAALTPSGVDSQTAVIFGYADGAQAVLHSGMDAAGPVRAVIIGTVGRIEIDPTWYAASSFTVFDAQSRVLERYEVPVEGRGMQYQALELERLVAEGAEGSDILPPAETVSIMASLDEIRRQVGLVFPGA